MKREYMKPESEVVEALLPTILAKSNPETVWIIGEEGGDDDDVGTGNETPDPNKDANGQSVYDLWD